jgi:hypothetical protein
LGPGRQEKGLREAGKGAKNNEPNPNYNILNKEVNLLRGGRRGNTINAIFSIFSSKYSIFA